MDDKRMKTFTIYILFFILYFVTGGGKGGVFKVKYNKIEGALTSVELLHDDGSPWCTLPDYR